MHRLFVAVDLPDEVRTSLAKMCGTLAGARWVPAEQLHLTLKFLGDVDDLTLAAVKQQLALVQVHPFAMSVGGLGHFPSGKHPRVIWVGIAPSDPLLELHRQIEHLLAKAAIPPDERRFSPHITLARLKEPLLGQVVEFEKRHAAYTAEPFTVKEFHLYSSVLSSKGAAHRREATYPLM